ncbi:hypothetical protein ACLB2K_026749 [Fragaria x ananassa]
MRQQSFEGSHPRKVISVGPFGSNSNKERGLWDDGVYSTVSQVEIQFDLSSIRWIQFEYVDENGRSVWSKRHGLSVPAVTKKHVVKLDYPYEFLTSVRGYYFDNMFTTCITELILTSNRRTYGPFGSGLKWANSFSIELKGSKIVGFHGRVNWYSTLVSLGAYLTPIDGFEHHDEDENLGYPAKPLLPAQDSTVYATPQKEGKCKNSKEISYIISGNQISGNEGNHNGTFVVGSKTKYVVINV